MIDREYNLNKPEDVRQLLTKCQKVKLTLSMIYEVNNLTSEASYQLKCSQEASTAEEKALMFEVYAKLKARRIRLYGKLKELCKITGYTCTRTVSGRISNLYARVASRGTPRPPGCITGINQKGLFVFADMFSEQYLRNLVVNDAIFRE